MLLRWLPTVAVLRFRITAISFVVLPFPSRSRTCLSLGLNRKLSRTNGSFRSGACCRGFCSCLGIGSSRFRAEKLATVMRGTSTRKIQSRHRSHEAESRGDHRFRGKARAGFGPRSRLGVVGMGYTPEGWSGASARRRAQRWPQEKGGCYQKARARYPQELTFVHSPPTIGTISVLETVPIYKDRRKFYYSTIYWTFPRPNRIPVSTSIGCPSLQYGLNFHSPRASVITFA